MTLREYARLVRDARTLQQEYFRARDPEGLRCSKEAERRLDEVTREVLAGRIQESFGFGGDA